MKNEDEDALICDLAETYNIYDYKKLPLTQVAIFAIGLKENSRIKLKMANQKVPTETLLLAGILDRLSVLLWWKTEDGQNGIHRPTMILDALDPRKNKESDVIVFNTVEDFQKTRNRLIKAAEGR